MKKYNIFLRNVVKLQYKVTLNGNTWVQVLQRIEMQYLIRWTCNVQWAQGLNVHTIYYTSLLHIMHLLHFIKPHRSPWRGHQDGRKQLMPKMLWNMVKLQASPVWHCSLFWHWSRWTWRSALWLSALLPRSWFACRRIRPDSASWCWRLIYSILTCCF